MTVGSGIFLIVVGAIIRYGLNLNIAGVQENTIGAILILAGIVVAILGLISAPFRWAAWRRGDYVPPEDRPPY
jgi:hypothetical protein